MKKMNKLLEVLEDKYGNIIEEMVSTENDPFKVLIRTVLSQRTRDENTDQASERLFEVGDSPKEILKIKEEKLKELIRTAGMYNQKAIRIREISKKILEDYDGKTPKTREELMKLPGVGYKTADITLMYGHRIPSIAVDTHCKRIPKRIGITNEEDSVEEIKERLEDITPKNNWYLVNVGIVKFGQDICRPRYPKCEICPITKYCDYYQKK
ncbi:MAG: endonuclease III [Candidatus Aenigmatarchaeota archaeon]